MNRREFVAVLGGTAILGAETVRAQTAKPVQTTEGGPAAPTAFAGKHPLKPLPFDPAKLKGLSEKLLRSHHENNYGGAVKNLNKVEGELAQVGKDTPGFLVSGLKEKELTYRNSVVLHEAYFGNLGGNGKPAGEIVRALSGAYGSFAKFEEHFRALATSLGGGSGWAILEYDLAQRIPRAFGSGHHTQAPAFGIPLLVLDLYEHSYALDYGAAAARYVDAFFQNLQWEEVDRRYARAVKAGALLT